MSWYVFEVKVNCVLEILENQKAKKYFLNQHK